MVRWGLKAFSSCARPCSRCWAQTGSTRSRSSADTAQAVAADACRGQIGTISGKHDRAGRHHGIRALIVNQVSGRVARRAYKTHADLVMVLMGLPGAGKGTQAQLLADQGWSHINVGGLIRSEVAAETAWGIRAAALMHRGDLLPSQDIQSLVARELERRTLPVVIEGYPRRIREAYTLFDIYGPGIRQIPVFLRIAQSTSIARLAGRLVCSQCETVTRRGGLDVCVKCSGPLTSRPDDTLRQTVYRRMRNFHLETIPLLALYQARGELETIDSAQDETAVHQEIIARIAARATGE